MIFIVKLKNNKICKLLAKNEQFINMRNRYFQKLFYNPSGRESKNPSSKNTVGMQVNSLVQGIKRQERIKCRQIYNVANNKIYDPSLSALSDMENASFIGNSEQNPQQVAGFVAKTFEILNTAEYTKIIYWSSNGTQFTIKDIERFEQIVLPKYFRHNKMNSFVRQLNMYGFHKTKQNNFKSSFHHPMFQKDKLQLLSFVKRKLKTQETEVHRLPFLDHQIKLTHTNKINFVQKQGDVTSSSLQKYFSFDNQIGTTKMINLSLKKVSINDFNSLQNLEELQDEDCASIEGKIQNCQIEQPDHIIDFQNVSCFFSSGFNL